MQQEVREWVARSSAEQGIPEKVTDPATIQKVVAILLEARRADSRARRTRRRT
jgi:hypothetical protein